MATTFSRWADACVPVWRTKEIRVDGQVLHVGDQAGRVGVSFFHPVAGAVGSVGNPVGLSKWCGQAGSTTGELRISVEPGCPHHGTVHSPSWLAENKVSAQVRGVTPLPAVASASRRDGPSVTMRWAWWRSRSTAAVEWRTARAASRASPGRLGDSSGESPFKRPLTCTSGVQVDHVRTESGRRAGHAPANLPLSGPDLGHSPAN